MKSHKNHTILKAMEEGVEVLVEIYYNGLDERLAFDMERSYIAHFGRRDTGTGCLTNLTDGGDGPSGRVHSAESIERRVSKLRGRPRTEEVKAKLRKPKSVPRSAEHTQKHRDSILGRKATPEQLRKQAFGQYSLRTAIWQRAADFKAHYDVMEKKTAHRLSKAFALTESQVVGCFNKLHRGWNPNDDAIWLEWMSLQHCL